MIVTSRARVLTCGAALAVVVGIGFAPGEAVAAPRVQRALDRVVDAGAPGAVALADGRVTTSGVADLRSRRPLRGRQRIRIGSVTKTFVAVVALQLIGEGRLRLDDTVGARLPGVLPRADGATLRQLLDHTSGVPDDVPSALREVFHGNPLRVWTAEDLVALAAAAPPRFPPGDGWAYSNTDYVLAALMIERATGRSLEREITERIMRPLRLGHTSFPVREASLRPPFARGYSLAVDATGRPIPGDLREFSRYSPSFAWASGNGVSTVADVARFYAAVLDGRLLSRELRRQALTTVPTGRPDRRYGLGIERYGTRQGSLVGHDGDIVGFSVRVRSTPDGRRQAIVATNAKFAPEAVDSALDTALEAAIGASRR